MTKAGYLALAALAALGLAVAALAQTNTVAYVDDLGGVVDAFATNHVDSAALELHRNIMAQLWRRQDALEGATAATTNRTAQVGPVVVAVSPAAARVYTTRNGAARLRVAGFDGASMAPAYLVVRGYGGVEWPASSIRADAFVAGSNNVFRVTAVEGRPLIERVAP